MLNLILHHTYSTGDGVAADTSDHGNHGIRKNTQFLPSGHEAYSGALEFNGTSSRVTVRHNTSLEDLAAVKVEAWIYPTLVDQRRNIIEGDDSFAIYLAPRAGLQGSDAWENSILHGDFRDTSGAWIPLSSEPPFSPATTIVPRNTWSKITYFHDGIASAVLMINDTVVAERYDLTCGVGSVGKRDLIIGSWTIDDRYSFRGSIDEIKLWKYDPRELQKEFFCRFRDAKALKCLSAEYRRWLANMDPKKIRQLTAYLKCQDRIVEDIIRTVFSHGRNAKETWERFHKRYLELWCKNKLTGPEMKKLMREWAEWLCRLVGPDTIRQWIHRLQSCKAEYPIETDEALRKIWEQCDREFIAFIDLFVDAWSRCIKQSGTKGGMQEW
jgi:hypothetical protein